MSILDIQVVETRQKIRKHIEEAIVSCKTSFKMVQRCKDGGVAQVEVTATSIELRDKQLLRLVMHDISEGGAAKADLKLKAELLDLAADSIVLSDLKLNIIYVNEAACRLSGFSQKELNKMNVRELIHPDYISFIDQHLHEVTEKGQSIFEDAYVSKGGSILLGEVHARLTDVDNRKVALSVVRDITQRKRAGAMLENKISVLVAVEEPLLADGIINAIAASGDLEVVARPSDLAETSKLIGKLQPRVAIIDFSLLGSNPYHAIEQMKQANRNGAIIVMTSKTTPSCLFDCLVSGAAGYLPKKTSATEVASAIRGTCAGEAVLDRHSVYEMIRYVSQSMGNKNHLAEERCLTTREVEVLKLASEGLTNKKIAEKLFVSERTVQSFLSTIFNKLGVGSRTEAVLAAWRMGWIRDDSIQ
jgi:PAS domain S-box-containing protein